MKPSAPPTAPPTAPGEQQISPIDTASRCSKCTFYFMSKIISLGHSRPLEKKDVPMMPLFDCSNTVDKQYKDAMNDVLLRNPSITSSSTDYSPWTSVGITLKARGIQFWYGGLCLILWSICYTFQPLYIKAILVEIQIKNLKVFMESSAISLNTTTSPSPMSPSSSSYSSIENEITSLQSLNPLSILTPLQLWIVCIITGVVQVSLLKHAFFYMFRFGLSIRLGFMNKIWEKALRLSSYGKLDSKLGNIQTLMAVDPARIMGGAIGVHWTWLGPVLIIAAVCLMSIEIGYVSLISVGILLIIIVVQINIVLRIKSTRRKLVKHTDQRIQLTNEILTGIRMIKCYSWEKHAMNMVSDARNKELYHLKWLLYYLAGKFTGRY
jgi:ABC-type multidrug transport system fused ATPase/permease subunit